MIMGQLCGDSDSQLPATGLQQPARGVKLTLRRTGDFVFLLTGMRQQLSQQHQELSR